MRCPYCSDRMIQVALGWYCRRCHASVGHARAAPCPEDSSPAQLGHHRGAGLLLFMGLEERVIR